MPEMGGALFQAGTQAWNQSDREQNRDAPPLDLFTRYPQMSPGVIHSDIHSPYCYPRRRPDSSPTQSTNRHARSGLRLTGRDVSR